MDLTYFSLELLWKSGVLAFIALFAPVNPVGMSMVVNPFFDGLNMAQRRVAARKVAIYCFFLGLVVIVSGDALLRLFGIQFAVIRMGGGLLLCGIAWRILFGSGEQDNNKRNAAAAAQADARQVLLRVSDKLFYPVAFPFTMGPGTIAVLISLTVRPKSFDLGAYFGHMLAVTSAVFAMMVLVYFCYAYTEVLIDRLGKNGAQVLNRISAFLVFCIGLQMVVTGVTEALPS